MVCIQAVSISARTSSSYEERLGLRVSRSRRNRDRAPENRTDRRRALALTEADWLQVLEVQVLQPPRRPVEPCRPHRLTETTAPVRVQKVGRDDCSR